MTAFTLYLILLKAAITSFSGFGSLPVLREELVVRRAVLSDEALNRAVLVARTTPGPMGVYVVSVGHQMSGVRGAIAGWLAMITPAVLILPLMKLTERVIAAPAVRNAISSLVLASAILLLITAGTLALALVK